MFITMLRSSSFNTYDECPAKYYLSYCLGMKSDGNIYAERGNAYHKAAEILARKALMEQNGTTSYIDDDMGEVFLKDINVEMAINRGYEHYVKLSPQYDWDETKDKKLLNHWMDELLYNYGGNYSPLNKKYPIVCPEQWFDFEIDRPWANYCYQIGGETLEGKLRLKGTADIVRSIGGGNLEILDFKTGKREDYATGKTKDFDYLCNDSQLRLYHYAISHLFPEAKEILFTIFYTQNGGPFTIPFSRSDLPETEKIIKDRFEEIQNCFRPTLKKNTKMRWKCKFCYFNTHNDEETGLSLCEAFEKRVRKHGVNTTFEKYGSIKGLKSYGSGGGKQNVE
jgi:hypothetical protein